MFFEKVLIGVLAIAMLLYTLFITRAQVRYWQNTRVLFEHALKVTENNAIAENMYGKILFNEGHPDQAVPHFINAAAIWPTFLEPKLNLGRAFLKQGKFGEAIACFNELVQQKDSAELHYNLAAALSMQKKYNEAINQLTRTLELNPEYPDAHNKMGMLLIAAGKPDEAITHLKQALETGDNEETYANLGTAYQKTGKNELAIQNWAKALQLKPAQVGVLHKLAWALATGENVTAEDANKAILYASNACELTTNKEPVLLDTLAAAYAAAGRFEDAITTANKALDIAKAAGQESLADEIQERIILYKSGRRYRQK
jgi:tetratricopeptide (TPR) repeat protein